MNYLFKLLFVLGAVIVTFFIYVFISMNGPSCGQEALFESKSPDNKYVAVAFEGSCGATTGFFREVHIREIHEDFKEDKIGRISSGLVCNFNGQSNIRFEWESPKRLKTFFSLPAKDIKCITRFNDVDIVAITE